MKPDNVSQSSLASVVYSFLPGKLLHVLLLLVMNCVISCIGMKNRLSYIAYFMASSSKFVFRGAFLNLDL